jgi:hypothetical protein
VAVRGEAFGDPSHPSRGTVGSELFGEHRDERDSHTHRLAAA